MTIRRRLITSFFVFPLIVFIAGGVIAIEKIFDDLQDANERAEEIASVVTFSLTHKLARSNPPARLDSPATQEFVENMKNENSYSLIVIDSTGTIVGDTSRQNFGKKYTDWVRNEVVMTLLDGVPREFVESGGSPGSGHRRAWRVVMRVRDTGSRTGAVLFDYTRFYQKAKAEILEENLIIGATVLLSVLFSIIMGRIVSRRLTRPILELRDSAGKIALGNLDVSIDDRSDDEIGILGRTFNKMAMELKASRQQLEKQVSELQESETLFRIATRVTRDSIWQMEWKDRRVTQSSNFWTRFGYATGEIKPGFDSWLEKIHPDDRTKIYASTQQSIASKSDKWEAEYRLRRADGTYADILDRCTILYDESGEPYRWVGALSDISDQKRAQRALAEREASFRLLFVNNPHPMWVYDVDSLSFLEVNDAAISNYGYSKEEFLQMNLLNICPVGDAEKLEASIVERRKNSSSRSGEWRHTRKDGSVFDVLVHSQDIEFLGRTACLVTAEDITMQKEAQEKLRESEVRFRSLIERSSEVTSIIDESGNFLYVSPSVSLMGYTIDEFEKLNAFSLLHPDDISRMVDGINLVLRQPVTEHLIEVRLKDKGGSWRSIEATIFNQLHVPGVRGIVINSRDITVRKKLEAQFLRAQRLESIGTLAGGIAHDLNNILAPIMLSIDMMREILPDGAGRKMVDTLEISTRRGADLVRQVLSFARGVEGDHTLVQIRHLIREIERILTETFPRTIAVATDVSKNLWTVAGDATQLHQVMMNLCVNARDAMPDGGKIEIKAENIVIDREFLLSHPDGKTGPYVLLTISDTGSGIPKSHLDRIFEPFFTTKDAGKGTGLGLSTVLTIVKSHNGFINAYSEEGRGTAFKVYFPAHATQVINQPERVDFSENLNGSGELVMVVDDEAAIREFTKGALEAYGYKVISASDGTEALSKLASSRHRVSLVITDMMMPYLEGTATIRAIKTMHPEIKVIAVSGLNRKESSAELAGAISFLQKPYTARKLLRAVRAALIGEQALPALQK